MFTETLYAHRESPMAVYGVVVTLMDDADTYGVELVAQDLILPDECPSHRDFDSVADYFHHLGKVGKPVSLSDYHVISGDGELYRFLTIVDDVLVENGWTCMG